MYNGLPDYIACNPTHDDLKDIELRSFYPKILIRLDHLLNIFLVERFLVKHGHHRTDLLRVTFEIVVLTLQLWTQKHIWAEVQGEAQWIVSH